VNQKLSFHTYSRDSIAQSSRIFKELEFQDGSGSKGSKKSRKKRGKITVQKEFSS
jgi:hypothetical protein